MQKQKKLKKLIASMLIAGSICVSLPLSVSAATLPNSISNESTFILVSETVEYLADGSYITTRIYESPNVVSSRAATYEKSGEKLVTYNNSDGKMVWKYLLSATFVVNPGVSATCKACYGTPSVLDSSWSVASNVPSGSGNKATGKITMQRKVLGTVVQTVSKTITITCDANGKLS